MRSMEVEGAGAGGGWEGSVGPHFFSHGEPLLWAGGAVRLPPEQGEEAGREDERRRSGKKRRWGRAERRKEWRSGSSENAMEVRNGGRRRAGFSAVGNVCVRVGVWASRRRIRGTGYL
jgi:hypothetical protein